MGDRYTKPTRSLPLPKKSNTGLIIGIVIGVILLITVGVVVIIILLRRRTTAASTTGTPVNCKYTVGDWIPEVCPCDESTQTRSIVVTDPAKNGGTCELPAATQTCEAIGCPSVDCVFTSEPWLPASCTCDDDVATTFEQSRQNTITTEAAYGGTECPPLLETTITNCPACLGTCSWTGCYDYGEGVFCDNYSIDNYYKADCVCLPELGDSNCVWVKA
jgi:hypothetical protein